MKKYFLLVSLLGGSSLYASDPMVGIENIDAQFFKDTVITDNPAFEKKLMTESLKDNVPSSAAPDDSDDSKDSDNSSGKRKKIRLSTPDKEEDDDDELSEEEEDDDEGFDFNPFGFKPTEYAYYMELIKEINPAVYEYMTKSYEEFNPNLVKAWGDEPYIECTITDNEWKPLIHMNSILKLSKEKQKAFLAKYVSDYEKILTEGPPQFSDDDYTHYMQLIKDTQPYGLKVYKALETCKEIRSRPCLLKGIPEDDSNDHSGIIAGSKKNYGYPLMVIPPNMTKEDQAGILRYLVDTYDGILSDDMLKLYQPTREFSSQHYDYYMSCIEKVNQAVSENLKACKKARGKSCLLEGTISTIIPATKESYGYPLVIINPHPMSNSNQSFVHFVYSYPFPLFEEERIHFLKIIQSFSPELYAKIVAIDPTGEHHILRHKDKLGASVEPLIKDGLPQIRVGFAIMHNSLETQRWDIGHELGHYVLDHFKRHTTSHPAFNTESTMTQEYSPDKKITGQLPFKPTFEKAFSRIQEYEADRFSVLNLGTTINGGIESLQLSENGRKQPEHPEKETFKETHPLITNRIKHLESLRPEVELQKAHGGHLPPIDWNALVEKYKKGSWQELQEAL